MENIAGTGICIDARPVPNYTVMMTARLCITRIPQHERKALPIDCVNIWRSQFSFVFCTFFGAWSLPLRSHNQQSSIREKWTVEIEERGGVRVDNCSLICIPCLSNKSEKCLSCLVLALNRKSIKTAKQYLSVQCVCAPRSFIIITLLSKYSIYDSELSELNEEQVLRLIKRP